MSAYPGALELVWVNASPIGPTKDDHIDPQMYQVIRVPCNVSKTISRSSAIDPATLVNDLSDKILFPLAKVVSREHARIEWVKGEPVIKNLGSTHGTYVAKRCATFLSSGQVVDGITQAPFTSVEGVYTLVPGDLIEFGKTCNRTDAQHHPVRCYVRFAPGKSISTSAQSSTYPQVLAAAQKQARRYSLLDDSLDSESDIVSIDEATFTTIPSRPSSQLTKTSPAPAGPVAIYPTQATIVDLSGDDNDEDIQSARPAASDFDSEDGGDRMKEHGVSVSESENLLDSLDLPHVLWRQLDQELADVPAAPSHVAQEVCWPATSDDIASASSAGEAHDDEPIEKPAIADRAVSSSEPISSTVDDGNKTLASPLSTPAPESLPTEPIQAVVTAEKEEGELHMPLKRKMMLIDSDDEEREGSVFSSQASSLSSMSLTLCTSDSGSPSPSKKRRTTVRHDKERRRPAESISPRSSIKTLITKAVYTTSLLSIGFLGGSFFTFKSMLNAAAAANAPGSGK
ncbi:uncharacterized protein UDID_00792 [Ustilago sp. UG-2017a]|nr:uncharacterized protein UDID_00792 [Ustilago sp. UG-2017a]